MAEIKIADGTRTVTLSNYDPEIYFSSKQEMDYNYLYGANKTEAIDMQAFTDTIYIKAFITDLTLFNDMMLIKQNQKPYAGGSGNTVTLYWNDDDSTKPLLDHTTADGTVEVKVVEVTLFQEKGRPSTQYTMTISLSSDIS